MNSQYNPLTFSALALTPFFTQACLPPFPDVVFVEDATITASSSDTGDTASSGELTLDDILTFSTTFVTNAQLYGGQEGFAYAVRVNVDEQGEEELYIQGDFSEIDYGSSALFSRDYPASYFVEGEHTAVFQGMLYSLDRDNPHYGKTIYTSLVEVPFTLLDNDTEAPFISGLTATPQYAGNDTFITLEATVTDNKGIESVLATVSGTEYSLSDEEGDSVYSTTLDPSLFSLTPTTEYTEFSFTVTAVDTNENSTTSDLALFYVSDVISPEVADAGTSTESDNSPLTTWTVYATATDLGTGVESVSVELNNNGVLSPLSYQGSDVYSLDITGDQLSSPSTTYTLYAFDYAGLEATTTGTVSVENITGITINDLVVSPSSVSNASSDYVTITLDVEDLQDDEVDLLASCTVDTLPVELSYQSGTQFVGIFDSSAFVVAQDYTVSCTVEDTDGYTATRNTTFTITDGLAPEISCSGTDGTNSTTSPSPLEISCTVEDETGLASSNPVTYTSAPGSGTLTNTSGSTYEGSISVEGVAAGTYTIDILATDATGNSIPYTLTPTVTDAIAPTYTSISASPSSVSNDGSSSFLVSAIGVADETAITTASITLNGTDYTLSDNDGDGTYETEALTPSSWSADTYSIDLTLSDGTNETTGSTTLTITDALAPDFSSCSATTAANDGSIDSTFTGVTTDETGISTVSYTADFSSGTLSPSSGSTYTASVDLTSVAAGTYAVDFTSADAAGNTSNTCTASFTLLDTLDPALICTLGSSSIGNNNTSTSLDCVVSEETGISSVTYSGFGSGSLTPTSSTDYSVTLTASSTTAAGTYTIPVIVTDTSSNSDDYSVTLTVTDATAPTISSVYTVVDGVSSNTVLDDGTQDFLVYACVNDETDGAELDGSGGVEVTIDSLTETLSYDSSSDCYVSRTIGGDELGAGTYTLSATATDAAGNSTTDISASLDVTCSAVSISNLAVSESTLYNNNTPSTFTVSADIVTGTCGGSVDTSSLEVTIDSVTESMTLSSGSTYVSGEFDAYGWDLGTYTITVSGSDTAGNTATDTSTITIADICDNLAVDDPTATIAVYQEGGYLTSQSTTIPSKMGSFNTLNLGAYGAGFDTTVILNYNNAVGEILTLSTSVCSGGSVSGSTYYTSAYHDCSLTNTYAGTSYPWSVSVYTTGSIPTLSLNSSTAGGTGTNWFQNSSSGLLGLDDGNGNRSYASVAAGGHITLCGDP